MVHDGNKEELQRLNASPSDGDPISGLGTVRFLVHCNGNAGEVLRRAKEVLNTVLIHSGDRWPSDEEWRGLLPAWFVARCAREKSPEEAEQWLEWWRGLNPEQQAEASRANWTLSNWLSWFEPDERSWRWWDARVETPQRILLAVAVDGWPFPWGALEWLFLASGTQRVEAEE